MFRAWLTFVGVFVSAFVGTVDAVASESCLEPTGHEIEWLEPMPDGLRAWLGIPYKRYDNGAVLQYGVRHVNGVGWSAEPVRACGGDGQPPCHPPGRVWCSGAECVAGPSCATVQLPPYTEADISTWRGAPGAAIRGPPAGWRCFFRHRSPPSRHIRAFSERELPTKRRDTVLEVPCTAPR